MAENSWWSQFPFKAPSLSKSEKIPFIHSLTHSFVDLSNFFNVYGIAET